MKMTFLSKNQEVKDVYSFLFKPEQPISWQAGQYMHYVLELPHPDDKGPERWFTISTAPFENDIRITTRLDNLPVSSFKQYLMDLRPGDQIEGDGPKGNFVIQDTAAHHVMIAGGIGITPYRAMFAQLAHDKQPANTTLLYANRDELFVFDDELASFAQSDETLKIVKFVDKRIGQDDLKPLLSDDTFFYLSGPKGLVEAYEQMLPTMGVAKEKIVTDYFPGY